MEKIIYLSKKLKAFTFDEIFLLAEMEKESLEKCLNELIENGTLKQDTQNNYFCCKSRACRFYCRKI